MSRPENEARASESVESTADPLLAELARAPARPVAPAPGATVGRFVLLDVIGRGGFGVVHRARDGELGRLVAVKIIRARGELDSRFRKEAETVARLNHPNIVTLHDFGTVGGCPYLVLELLTGETLENRIARGPLTVDEAVPIMIQVARGLEHAHRAGVIHRDLKPGNVFLLPDGQVKVLDFGLARLRPAATAEEAQRDGSPEVGRSTRDLAGTPAYMAPEQWRGELPDERTDVYAAGLMLFEMLAGQRPWPAADPRVAALAPQSAPRVPGVPGPLADLIAAALAKERSARLPSASALLERLGAVKRALDGARALRRARRVRRALIAAVPLLVAAAWSAAQIIEKVRRDRAIATYLAAADTAIAEARAGEPTVDLQRRAALAEFDRAGEHAEEQWAAALAASAGVDGVWGRAGQLAERGFVLDPSRTDVRRRLGEVLLARALIAERDHHVQQRQELSERLATYGDGPSRARWQAPARLSVATTPEPAAVAVHRYDGKSAMIPAPIASSPATPLTELSLPPGSYLLRLVARGGVEVRYPVLLARGETLQVTIPLPASVPDGYVYIAPGRFLFGSADETFRSKFNAQPEHAVATAGYLIARHEVTFADWIEFLEQLPQLQRESRMPRVDGVARSTAAIGSGADDLELQRLPDGAWQLSLRGRKARADEPFIYGDRPVRRAQRWTRFPVAGISFEDARAYTEWLDRTGRLHGARVCTEREWEHAARGADGRLYPHGDRIDGDDADIDVTYGRKSLAFGPDEVGSHPASDSPFGVSDLAGNVWEWTVSVGGSGAMQIERGGNWYQDAFTARSDNREVVEPTFHSGLIGLRVCASL